MDPESEPDNPNEEKENVSSPEHTPQKRRRIHGQFGVDGGSGGEDQGTTSLVDNAHLDMGSKLPGQESMSPVLQYKPFVAMQNEPRVLLGTDTGGDTEVEDVEEDNESGEPREDHRNPLTYWSSWARDSDVEVPTTESEDEAWWAAGDAFEHAAAAFDSMIDVVLDGIVNGMASEHVDALRDVSWAFDDTTEAFQHATAAYRDAEAADFVTGSFDIGGTIFSGFAAVFENFTNTANQREEVTADERISKCREMMEDLFILKIRFMATTFETLTLTAIQAAIDMMELLMMGAGCGKFGDSDPEDAIREVRAALDVVSAKFGRVADAYHWGADCDESDHETEIVPDSTFADPSNIRSGLDLTIAEILGEVRSQRHEIDVESLEGDAEERDGSDLDEASQSALPHASATERAEMNTRQWIYIPPKVNYAFAPARVDCLLALADLELILRPRRDKGPGHKPFQGDDLLRERLDIMALFLSIYTRARDDRTFPSWTEASEQAAVLKRKSKHMARRLREWTRKFLADREDLPMNPYGKWQQSILANEDFADELRLHLQAVGKYVCARDIVTFTNEAAVRQRYALKKGIGLRQAQVWMHHLGYRWSRTPKGQYVDGHEREDVRAYRDDVFLPKMAEANGKQRLWNRDGSEDVENGPQLQNGEQIIVDHYHDETHFCTNDRREIRWVHVNEKPVPHAKTEGATLMIADFVSAEYGWLRSPDGLESTRLLFKSGKARDGYLDNQDILRHVTAAMDILQKYFPGVRHRFIFDNATIHRKRPDDALSARQMPKSITAPGKVPFGVWRTKSGPDGKAIHGTDGKVIKEKISMANGRLPNGDPQPLYFPEGHPHAGAFKGMVEILVERGYLREQVEKLLAQCKGFKCGEAQWDPENPCCCRRILYNEPDFVDVPSILEAHCAARGFEVVFLPKFHCELNPIEQCWGRAKRYYRDLPPTSKEADLERNALEALDSVPLVSMRRYKTCTLRFEDAYRRKLSGKQAAWATKKYRGHRVLPNNILRELELKGITE